MEIYFKKISYCLSFVIFFFVFSVFVSAEQFTIEQNFTLNGSKGGLTGNYTATNPKCKDTGDHKCNELVFCTDHDYNFAGARTGNSSSVQYGIDTNFMNLKTCHYWGTDNLWHNNGDCSELAGYVLAWANFSFTYSENSYLQASGKLAGISLFADDVGIEAIADSTKRKNQIWYWKQVSLWAYFALTDSKGDIGLSNNKANGWYENNQYIQTVINRAMLEYAKHSQNGRVSLSGVEEEIVKDVNFSLGMADSSSLKRFYFVPNPGSSSCDVSGFYRTAEILVQNNESKKVNVSISTNNQSNVEVCVINENQLTGKTTTTCDSTVSFDLNSYNDWLPDVMKELTRKKFYLKSEYDEIDPVDVNVVVSYDDEKPSSAIQYDTTRYVTDRSNRQGMMTWINYLVPGEEDVDESGKDTVTYASSKSMTFNRAKMVRRTCGDNEISDGTGGGNNSNGSAVSNKICAPSDTTADFDNTVEQAFTANFSDCTCLSLDFMNKDGVESKVNIIVSETAFFQFGKLVSEGDLYAGGGFSFDQYEVPTYYKSKIAWTFANYYDVYYENNKGELVTLTSTPYYYNPDSPTEVNNASLEINNIERALEEKIIKQLQIKFSTRDSNDYKYTDNVNVTINMPVKEVSVRHKNPQISGFNGWENDYVNVFEFESDGFLQMKEAYFSAKGKVDYSDDGEVSNVYNIPGGNSYYVPMNFEDEYFPFDIVDTDLSIFEGIHFNYKAKCGVPVGENDFATVYYRSINLENPFPRANSDKSNVPANWRQWLYGDDATINDRRLRRTYQDYPNYPLYSITVNADILEDMKKNYIHNYTDWYGMAPDSSSSFVGKYFDYKGNMSYCPLGQFSSECDN